MRLPCHRRAAAFAFAAAAALAGCGSEPRADPAAVDAHLNQIRAHEEAERQRLVAEARAREQVRMQETKERVENYTNTTE